MEAIRAPEIIKQSVLDKLGGGAGGHKNWKARYFVLSDHLYYYNDQSVSATTDAGGGGLRVRSHKGTAWVSASASRAFCSASARSSCVSMQ